MKNCLLGVILFLFASASFASVCDGVAVSIRNGAGHTFTVKNKYPKGNTTIRHIHSGDKIPSGTTMLLHAYSGRWSAGDASGKIVLNNAALCEGDDASCVALAITYDAHRVWDHIADGSEHGYYVSKCVVSADVKPYDQTYLPVLTLKQGDAKGFPGEINIIIGRIAS